MGPGTAFDPATVSQYKVYTEPWLANTVLIAECDSREPWTRPVDIAYSSDAVVPRLGGFTSDGFLTLSCDGAVHFIEQTVSPGALRGYMTTDVSDSFSIPGIPFKHD